METKEDNLPGGAILFELSTELAGPLIEPIQAIHRGHDGFVTFHRKWESQWEDLFSIRASELAMLFPSFRAEIERDSYFSINSFYRHGSQDKRGTGLHGVWRRQEALRYLCACFADLDCYNVGLSTSDALGGVVRFQDNGTIPPASLITRSGRGVWLFWILHDPRDTHTPTRSWPENASLWFRVQRAIGERLAELGADANARDAARVTRVPGSIHTQADRRVMYWLQGNANGQGYTYTLAGLAEFFGIENPFRLRNPSKRRGWLALHASRLRQFEDLRKLRRCLPEGCRNRAALLYAHLLKKNGKSLREIDEAVERLACECRPPLSNREWRAAIRVGLDSKTWRFSDRTISDWFDITPGEARYLESWKPATRFLGQVPISPESHKRTRKEQVGARRDAIRKTLDGVGFVPSTREMSEQLSKLGIVARHVQVSLDYKAMGIISRWKDRARQKHAAREKQDGFEYPDQNCSHTCIWTPPHPPYMQRK